MKAIGAWSAVVFLVCLATVAFYAVAGIAVDVNYWRSLVHWVPALVVSGFIAGVCNAL